MSICGPSSPLRSPPLSASTCYMDSVRAFCGRVALRILPYPLTGRRIFLISPHRSMDTCLRQICAACAVIYWSLRRLLLAARNRLCVVEILSLRVPPNSSPPFLLLPHSVPTLPFSFTNVCSVPHLLRCVIDVLIFPSYRSCSGVLLGTVLRLARLPHRVLERRRHLPARAGLPSAGGGKDSVLMHTH